MNCRETEGLIHGYLDGELDLVRSLEIEQHLEACADCSRMHGELAGLQQAIRRSAPYFRAPADLRRNVEARLGGRTPARNWLWWPRLATVAAGLAVFGVVVWNVSPRGAPPELVADHIRSLMANHLTDVPSTDQHTVKPWFNGKLDFSPAVKNLDAQGFALAGGRLDYLEGRPVAALVYRRRQHVINLFTWPAAALPDRGEESRSRQGYNTVTWTRAGMSYAAVSDLNAKELREFVSLVQ